MRRMGFGILVVIGLLIAGCASLQCGTTRCYKCAWCKSVICSKSYQMWDNGQVSYYTYPGELSSAKSLTIIGVVGRDGTLEQIMDRDLQNSVSIWVAGQPFCGLRCKNSYLASTGIKENRIRVIEGE